MITFERRIFAVFLDDIAKLFTRVDFYFIPLLKLFPSLFGLHGHQVPKSSIFEAVHIFATVYFRG